MKPQSAKTNDNDWLKYYFNGHNEINIQIVGRQFQEISSWTTFFLGMPYFFNVDLTIKAYFF